MLLTESFLEGGTFVTEWELRSAMERCGDMVYRLALCRLQDQSDAEDVYQEVFLRLFRCYDAADGDVERMKAWLIRTTVNRCNDVMRFRFRHGTVSIETLGEAAAEESEAFAVWDAVAQLPGKFRTVVHLHYAEGYSTEEIAKILSIPPATVRSRLRRARRKLKSVLGGNDDE